MMLSSSAAQQATLLTRVSVPPFDALGTPNTAVSDPATVAAVTEILTHVRDAGDTALLEYQERFDGVSLACEAWEISMARCHAAHEGIDQRTRDALTHAADRIRDFHEPRVPATELSVESDGSMLGTRIVPIARVGIYVPDGRAAYPSRVLMTAIPALVAGVEEIVVVTPPSGATPHVMAACSIAGVTRLFQLGGAHACAALAYGTDTIPRVDKIVGPGSRWVAEAKRQLAGVVGIDAIAGPTGIMIVADGTADPVLVAADMLAQAEHDPDARARLVTTDAALADAVETALATQLTGHAREDIARASLQAHGMVVLVADLSTAVAVVNREAPEHVEVITADARNVVEGIRNAGAIFVGAATPESVGDYVAGPSHVLPTGGTARFGSPLGVEDFVKRISVIEYSAARLRADANDVVTLAEVEGLQGHADAVRLRLPEGNA